MSHQSVAELKLPPLIIQQVSPIRSSVVGKLTLKSGLLLVVGQSVGCVAGFRCAEGPFTGADMDFQAARQLVCRQEGLLGLKTGKLLVQAKR